MSHSHDTTVSSIASAANVAMEPKFMINMYLHTEISDYFLLKDWKLFMDEDAGWMVLCAFGTFGLAFVYEFLKVIVRLCSSRVSEADTLHLSQLYARANGGHTNGAGPISRCDNARPSDSCPHCDNDKHGIVTSQETTDRYGSFLSAPASNTDRPANQSNSRVLPIINGMHLLQMVVYAVQLFVSYLLMLIAMSYSVWLVLPILLGSTVGYFVLEWRSSNGMSTFGSSHPCPHCIAVVAKRPPSGQ